MFKSYLEKMRLNEPATGREKIIFLLTFLIGIFVFMKSCWAPSNYSISQVKDNLNQVEIEVDELRRLLGDDSLAGEKTVNNPDMSLLVKYGDLAASVADDPNTLIMREFSNPGLLRDIKLESINLNNKSVLAGMMKQEFDLVVSGSFMPFLRYLNGLESLPILVVIDKIKVDASQGKLGNVKVNAGGVVYGWK